MMLPVEDTFLYVRLLVENIYVRVEARWLKSMVSKVAVSTNLWILHYPENRLGWLHSILSVTCLKSQHVSRRVQIMTIDWSQTLYRVIYMFPNMMMLGIFLVYEMQLKHHFDDIVWKIHSIKRKNVISPVRHISLIYPVFLSTKTTLVNFC